MKKLLSLIAVVFAFSMGLSPLAQDCDKALLYLKSEAICIYLI